MMSIYGLLACLLPLLSFLYPSIRGCLKLAQQACNELGVLASSVTGVDLELKTEASFRHARTLLAANQFSEVRTFLNDQPIVWKCSGTI